MNREWVTLPVVCDKVGRVSLGFTSIHREDLVERFDEETADVIMNFLSQPGVQLLAVVVSEHERKMQRKRNRFIRRFHFRERHA